MLVTDARARAARSFMALMASAVLSTAALADAPSDEASYPVDDRQQSFDITLQENIRGCMERTNNRSTCASLEQQRLSRDFPMRGTRQYVQAYYLPMKTDELLDVRRELQEQQKRARSQRDFWIDNPRPAGELTKEMLSNELTLIDQEMDKRRKQGTKTFRDLKRIFDK